MNLKELAALEVDALIADTNMRSRDERFADQKKYKALPDPIHDKGGKPKKAARYQPTDFDYDPQAGTCISFALSAVIITAGYDVETEPYRRKNNAGKTPEVGFSTAST